MMKAFSTNAAARHCRNFLLICGLLLSLSLVPFTESARAANSPGFYLKPGDRVCFYGDSITEQRFYGMDVQTYVRTRFPSLHVKFVNSGVGGDKVTGGWAGPIDRRLKRDVFPFKPTVVTIMLGMNDARYRSFDAHFFEVYTNGYEHIIRSLQAHLPGVRIVLIQPTPYDDITHPPKFPGGYNAVLLRYAAFVRHLAAEHHLICVDFMTPLLDVLRQAQAENPKLAREVIPGRIHPSAVGELVMAQALLKAWKAPATVTSVALDASGESVIRAANTAVTDLQKSNGTLSWSQKDQCLPFPILGLHDKWWQFPPTERDWGSLTFFTPAPKPDWNHTEPAAKMIVRLSGFYSALDEQPLKITGLKPGHYELKINGESVGRFSADELESGINLARYHTPMMDQAYHVLDLVWKQVAWRFFAWRGIQTQLSFDRDPAVRKAARSLIAALENQKEGIVKQQYAAAQPSPTHYELVPQNN